ncbi:MAG: NAD-dependent deacetylase [Firmicutes bacterium]|nr:NAD-dependent deacetylase [Bacillota bacterium]
MDLRKQINELADMLLKSPRTVVMTGAGISTESGIPDFRGPGGLWSKVDPTEVFHRRVFLTNPRVFYEKGLPHLLDITRAKPNTGHYVIAGLEKAGLISAVVTQNVDGLHQAAGSRRVFELHGHLRTATCLKCRNKTGWEQLMEEIRSGTAMPVCGCGGVYKPDAVFFGDPLPLDYDRAVKEVSESMLTVVVGSSLEVSPANCLPGLCRYVSLINLEPTAADRFVTQVIRSRAGTALSLLWEELKRRGAVGELEAG